MAKRAGIAPPVEPARAADATTERPALPTAQQHTLPQREITLQGDYPARIGRYVVLKGLGQGGMGTVYLAYDADLDRRVAIKVVREDMELGAILRARVMKEAQAMARMSHPNVVHVYEVGEDRSSGQSQVFIAMEYVPGTSLDGLQQAKPARDVVALDQLLQLYLQAAAGLEAAHRSGLIHRDTKQSLRSTESVGRTERGKRGGNGSLECGGSADPACLGSRLGRASRHFDVRDYGHPAPIFSCGDRPNWRTGGPAAHPQRNRSHAGLHAGRDSRRDPRHALDRGLGDRRADTPIKYLSPDAAPGI